MDIIQVLNWAKDREPKVYDILKLKLPSYLTKTNKRSFLEWSLIYDDTSLTDFIVDKYPLDKELAIPHIFKLILTHRPDVLNDALEKDITNTLFVKKNNGIFANIHIVSLELFSNAIKHGLNTTMNPSVLTAENVYSGLRKNNDFLSIFEIVMRTCKNREQITIHILRLLFLTNNRHYNQNYNDDRLRCLKVLLKFYTMNTLATRYRNYFCFHNECMTIQLLEGLKELGLSSTNLDEHSRDIIKRVSKSPNNELFEYVVDMFPRFNFKYYGSTHSISSIYENLDYVKILCKRDDFKSYMQYFLETCTRRHLDTYIYVKSMI